MKLTKVISKGIFSITNPEAHALVAKAEKKEKFKREEKRCYLVEYPEEVQLSYLVLDNRKGDCKMYQANSMEEALAYICDIPLIAQELEAHKELEIRKKYPKEIES